MSAVTGFPEPFCKYRNTTRIHPDAKVGNDAIIGGEANFIISNKRRFSVKHNDKHTISWGNIDPADDSDASESMHRPSRSSLTRLISSHPELAMQQDVPPLPVSLRRGVSFAIAEGDEEDARADGILSVADMADMAAGNGLAIHGDLSIVERRRRDGHHRIGSVDSEMSATSNDSYSEIHGSGDEGPDSIHHSSKPRKKRSFFRLIRRVSSRGSLRRENSF
jgi:hypothetical protein